MLAPAKLGIPEDGPLTAFRGVLTLGWAWYIILVQVWAGRGRGNRYRISVWKMTQGKTQTLTFSMPPKVYLFYLFIYTTFI